MKLRPDHFTILTDDLSTTEDFYREILGLSVGERPDFSFAGSWLYSERDPILHVVKVNEMPNPRKGVLDHMAFRGEGINALLQHLRQAEVEYRVARTPKPWVQWQVFFEDPNGALCEVDFDGNEFLDPVLESFSTQ